MSRILGFLTVLLWSGLSSFSQTITISEDFSISETDSNILTATLNASTSNDVKIDLVVTGTANNSDYSTSFTHKGEETLITNGVYNKFNLLADGRYLFHDNDNLQVYDPSTEALTTYTLPRNHDYLFTTGNTVYAVDNTIIYKLDISDLSSITDTPVVSLSSGQSFSYHPSAEGDNLLYNVYDGSVSNNNRIVYKKEGTNDPEIVYQGSNCCYASVLLNDRMFQFSDNLSYEIIDGEYTNYTYYSSANNIPRNHIKVFNGEIYAPLNDQTDSSNYNVIAKLSLPVNDGNNDSGDYGTFDVLPITMSLIEGSPEYFAVEPQGNLIIHKALAASSGYGTVSYQLQPQFKITAGETTGTITFAGATDTLDETDETIILTPGTPTSGDLTDSSAITLTITDTNDPPVVTFALSATNVVEGSSAVTLTATIDPSESALDVTIPFTLSGSAASDEYSIANDATSIVIPAGSASASISISAVDDTDVEAMQTIIFTIGTIDNGSSETTGVTLNLESDDDSIVTSIVAAPSSFEETGASIITATINTASSRDLTIPLTITGTATATDDYTSSFPSLGVEELMMEINANNNEYSNFHVLDDGRYIFLSWSTLRVFDPSTGTSGTYSLSQGSDYWEIVGNMLYGKDNSDIYSFDITDLNNIVSTLIVEPSNNTYFSGYFLAEGTTLIFREYHQVTGVTKTYKKEGDDPKVEIDTGTAYDDYFYYNNVLHAIYGQNVFVYANGEFTSTYVWENGQSSYPANNGKFRKVNNKFYFNYGGISELKLDTDNNTMSYSDLNYTLSSDINSMKAYGIDPNTNDLLLYNQSVEGVYSVYSYQQDPQLKVAAGDTAGTITFTGVDDNSDEANETIIITPGTPINGSLDDSSDIIVTITDDDDPPAVTLAFSSATITEGASTAVTLTATATPISGLEITVPFTISTTSTAGADEYSIVNDATSIVIPAGSASASISISTDGIDDTDVEPMETIIFTIGDITNGTLGDEQTAEVTLNLESDDDSTVTSIAPNPTSFEETSTRTITATIDAASSRDLTVPLTLTGTATATDDYTYTFASKGEESGILNTGNNNYADYFGQLSDGRYVMFNGNILRTYNASTDELVTYSMQRSYGYIHFENDIIYGQYSNDKIYSIEIIDGTTLEETLVLEIENGELNDGFSLEGDTFYYIVYNGGSYYGYKKEGENEPEQLYQWSDCCWSPIIANGKFYGMRWNYWTEMAPTESGGYNTTGQHYPTDENGNSMNMDLSYTSVEVFNGKIYLPARDNNAGTGYRIWRLDTENNQIILLDYTPGESASLDSSSPFIIDNDGNLVVYYRYADQNDGEFRGIRKYQLAPQLKVAAGDTEGTITFTGVDDNSDEADETIILTPGTPTNGSLTDSSAITVTITDNDDPPAVTLAFSSETIVEGASTAVTLTATATPVSGQEITIPFTLSGTAGADEYSIVNDATSIVIPVGSETGSISISTDGIDDTIVEPMETIIFTIGTITNGTLGDEQTTDITLNLESDDDPPSALSATNPDMNEGESTSITLTLDAPTSADVIVPLILTGTATHDIDYTTNFDTQGQESEKLKNIPYYNEFDILEDGRYIFLHGSTIAIRDPAGDTLEQMSLDNYFNYLNVSGSTIYLKSNQRIHKVDVAELVAGNTITTTEVVSSAGFGPNDYFSGSNIAAEGDTILYQVYDWPNGYEVYKKEGDNAPELLYEGNGEYAERLLLFNNRVYRYTGNYIRELYNGEYTNEITYSNKYIYRLKKYNGQVYALAEDQLNDNQREVLKLSIESDIINSSGNQGNTALLPYNLGEYFWYMNSFAFDAQGNLVLYNQTYTDGVYEYGVYSYQLFPQISVSAGNIEGTFTFSSTEDLSYEDTETVIITPGDPINATIASDQPLTLNIIDDDNPPLITFELSSDSIEENSEYSVTLTATADVQSGVEITVPFTLSGSADADEYTIVGDPTPTSIVIPPNATSASITISTYGLDDDEVEVSETIIFNFISANIVNADTETENITLNLISEDFSTVDSISSDTTEINEDGSAVVSLSISDASSVDVYIPLTMSGTATLDLDYITTFESEGEQTIAVENVSSSLDNFHVLADGRYIFLNNSTITTYDPSTQAFESAQLSQSYYHMDVENNDIYVARNEAIYKLDITDISAGQTTVELIVDLSVNNQGLDYGINVENGAMVYGVYANSGGLRQTYLIPAIGVSSPLLMYSGSDCCYKPILVDGDIYAMDTWSFRKLEDGVLLDQQNYWSAYGANSYNKGQVKRNNGNIYVEHAYDGSNEYISMLNFETGEFIKANANLSDDVNSIKEFAFNPEGNLLMLSQSIELDDIGVIENDQWNIYSYMQTPHVKINAGETDGSITFTSIDDESYEQDEFITITPAAPVNANLATLDPLDIYIMDNDTAPEVTFELSEENIPENSSETVSLTATLTVVSGYDTTIQMSMDGTADLDTEYTVSTTTIVIPAGSESGSVTVSTEDLDDEEVEMLETIIFTIVEITNGTSQTTEVILNLESDDDPTLVSIIAEPLEFAEHQSALVTATIDAASSRDVYVPISVSGTAIYNVDYSAAFASQGNSNVIADLTASYNDYGVLDDGRLVFLQNYYTIIIRELDGTMNSYSIGNQSEGGISMNATNFIVAGNNLYLRDWAILSKLDLTTFEQTAVGSGFTNTSSNQYRETLAYANDKLFYMVRGYQGGSNTTTIYSRDNSGVISEIYSEPSDQLFKLAVNDNEEIYVVHGYDKIYRIEGNEKVEVLNYSFGQGTIYDMKFHNGALYAHVYSNEANGEEIISVNTSSILATGAYSVLQGTTEPEDNSWSIDDFAFGPEGVYLFTNNLNPEPGQTSNTAITFKSEAEIAILAGSTSGVLELIGIEDDLNSPGEETDETIILNFASPPINANVDEGTTFEDITLTLLNNEISLEEDLDALANVPGLTDSSVAWGDYDRDGDQDMAIMGLSWWDGTITRLYENIDGVFVNSNPGIFDGRKNGDIMWVDFNKDGYIDLIVSGLNANNEASTTIYENIDGQTFSPSTQLTLPDLFQSSMDSGDFDNDGDIDFAINGMDDENMWRKYIYLREGPQLLPVEDYNNQFDSDNGVDSGIVKIADFNLDGDQDLYIFGESNSRLKRNTFINNTSDNNSWFNDNLPQMSLGSVAVFGDYIYAMGIDNDNIFFRRSELNNNNNNWNDIGIEGLKDGDIAIGDYNNDGLEDILVTGEDSSGSAITKLYDGVIYPNVPYGGFTENTDHDILGLRASTAKWVDYDSDGDLDLFITGVNDDGEFAKLYKTNLLNKTNTPADAITNLSFESLGNGKVRLSWTAPNDDFSTNPGYVVRLGTTEGGTELSNTESNLETGERLITKSPEIYTNSYETILDPGNYYWSVQSVDDGLKGSAFSEEQQFQLTYEWKLLNQGGIIDRSIQPLNNPIVNLTDIDADNDMDLVYGSREGGGDTQIFRLGDDQFEYFNSISNSQNITNIEFLDFNDDNVQDVLINSWNSSSNNGFRLYNSLSSGGFSEIFQAPGLAEAKIELIDINNDGLDEIIQIGRTSTESNSELKVYVFERSGNSLVQTPLDISDQLSGSNPLINGAFAFGDIDLDNDKDFAITGYSNFGARSDVFSNETVYTETIAPIFTEIAVDFPVAVDATLDFIDFDADGDLDMALTGTGPQPMFKILSNNGLTGDDLEFVEIQNTGLTPIRDARLEFGDYNGDGYLDILYSGTVTGQGEITKLVEYDPTTQSYVDSDFDLTDIVNASIAFGDIDGDNDLDFTISGESTSGSNDIIKTYLNVRNESADVQGGGSSSNSNSSVQGNILDDQPVFIVNEQPTVPGNLSAEQIAYNPDLESYRVKFTWDASSDDHTPVPGLTYGLKVGTYSGGDDVMKVNSLANGYRLSAGKGNVEHNIEWILNVPEGEYYWSVQAIDASYSGSYFSDTEVFFTTSGAAIVITSPQNGETLPYETSSVTISFTVGSFDLSDDGSGDGYIKWSINGVSQDPVYNTDDIDIDVENQTTYTIEMWLVDNNGNSLDVQTSVTFSVDGPGPSITINSPLEGATFPGDTANVIIDYTVGDFEVAQTGGEGYIRYSVNSSTQWNNLYTTDDIVIDVTSGTAYEVTIQLVDYSDNVIVEDQVTFYIENMPAQLMLQGIIDFDVPEGSSNGKAIHLYAMEHIDDLSVYGIGVANNGGGSDGLEYSLDAISANAGDHILIARNVEAMDNYMNANTYWDIVINASSEAAISHNGDDAIELFMNGEVIETFGDINVDGTNQDWEYTDSWAYKVDGEGGDHQWTFGGINCTDDSTTTWDTDCVYPYVATFSTPENELFDIMIYPNPVDGNFINILSSINGSKEIEIIDLNGRRILNTIVTNNQLDVSRMSSGVYILRITINNRSKIFKLIVK